MARSGIRYEDVQAAAETLLGRGLNPTIQRVREVLGTGSNTTISEHLKSWQQQLAEAPKAILPPATPEAVATAMDAFWKIAVQHAEAAFEEQRATAAQAVAVAEQARAAAIAEQQQLQADADQLRRQIETAQAVSRELADRLLVEQERRAAAEIAIQAAAQRVQAATETIAQIRAETAARIAQAETALQQTRTDMAHQLAEARQRFEVERQRSEASEARLLALLDQVRTEQTAERQVFVTERQDWKKQEAAWREQREIQHRELVELRTTLAAAEEREQALVREIQQLRPMLQRAETRGLDAVREAEALRGELKATLADRQRLQQQLEARPAHSSGPAQLVESQPQ